MGSCSSHWRIGHKKSSNIEKCLKLGRSMGLRALGWDGFTRLGDGAGGGEW